MASEDLIELGVVRGAYGLKGWVRVTPFAVDGSVLESARRWWLLGDAGPRPLVLQEVKRHAESILAKWEGCESKEVADAFKGGVVAVARGDFPVLGEGEHYLSDVVGYRVVNREGCDLGSVTGIRSGTDTQWLEVEGGGSRRPSLLIPLVDQYLDAIEPNAKMIKVDWQSDW